MKRISIIVIICILMVSGCDMGKGPRKKPKPLKLTMRQKQKAWQEQKKLRGGSWIDGLYVVVSPRSVSP